MLSRSGGLADATTADPRVRLALGMAAFFFGSRLGDNLPRLLGVHRLSGTRASALLGVSPQSLSDWSHGKRDPEAETLERIAAFFEVPADRLAKAEFEDLLAHELSDPARFRRVEGKMHHHPHTG